MKKFFALLTILMTAVLTACSSSQSVSNDVIVIGIDDEFAPLAFRDEQNKLVGFDIDLANETAKRMGVTFKFKPIDWQNKREEITSGNVDIIWNGLDINDERREYMIFSEPYMLDSQVLLIKKGNRHAIRSEKDLVDKIAGVQAGSDAENFVNTDAKLKAKLKTLKAYDKFWKAINALKNDEIDVFLCDELVARYEMHQQPDQFELIPVLNGVVTEMGIGFRKDDVELRDRVQKAFDEVVKDGTAKKISEKWFQADLIRFKP